MNKEDELLQKRIKDLANRSYNNNVYTFTDFLSLADASVYYETERDIRFVKSSVFGGDEDCERIMVRFGSEEQLGYEEAFPIQIIHIKPLAAKFSDDLSHRDILGALMNLGIERTVLGDIRLFGNEAYVFCTTGIADFICENLTRIKHTSVLAAVVEDMPQFTKQDAVEKVIQIQSERIDAVIAKVYNFSRSQCIPLFAQKKIFVNGRLCENNSLQLKAGDVITVRGNGRFTFEGVEGVSRKGKLNAKVKI